MVTVLACVGVTCFRLHAPLGTGVAASQSSFPPLSTHLHYLHPIALCDSLRSLQPSQLLRTATHRVLPLLFQPHKVLSKLANPVFDVLPAIPYLIHFPLPFLFGAYLVIHPSKRGALFPYMWCAGWVNLLSVVIQFVFPTASPWFVDSAVLDQHGNIIYEYANEAGFKRLDRMCGFSIFHNSYSHSPLKFGAFPF